MSNEEMNKFQDEILKKIKELETRLFTHLSKKNLEINMNYEDFSEKVNSILESNRLMIESITNQKINFEKISKLESLINVINEKLTTHDIRINNIINDIKKMKFNYDKILNDNLIIPTYIGPGSMYKSIGDFIVNSINEFKIFKEEKEKLNISNIELKNKLDSMMKNMSNFVEFNSARCMAYTDAKEKEFQEKLDSKMKQIDEKNLEGNQGVYAKQIKSEAKINELGNELNKLLEDKNNINNKFEKIELNEGEINEELKKVSNEVFELKIMKRDLSEKIKYLTKKIENINKESKSKFFVQQNKDNQDILPVKKNKFNSVGNIFHILNNNNNINNTLEEKNKKEKNEFPNLSNIFNSLSPNNTKNKEKTKIYRNEKKDSLFLFNSKTEEESKDIKNIIKKQEEKNINENKFRKSTNNIFIKEKKISDLKNKILKSENNFISPKIISNNKITIKEKIYQTSVNNLKFNSFYPKNKYLLSTEKNENHKVKNNDINENQKRAKNLKMLEYENNSFGRTKIELNKNNINNKKEESKQKNKFNKNYQDHITQTSFINKEIDNENPIHSNDNQNIIKCNLINLNLMDLPENKNSINLNQNLNYNSFDSNFNDKKSKIDSKNKTVSSNFSKTANAFYTYKDNN